MDVVGPLLKVAVAFRDAKIPFMVIGGVAVSHWVPPRLTQDVDVVVRVEKRHQGRLKTALIHAGARITTLEMRLLYEKRFIRLKHLGLMLDVHLCLSAHDRAALEQAQVVEKEGIQIPIAAAEDIVLYKLQAWRPQDQVDIDTLLRRIRDLDKAYIEHWLGPIEQAVAAPMRRRWEAIGHRPPGSPEWNPVIS